MTRFVVDVDDFTAQLLDDLEIFNILAEWAHRHVVGHVAEITVKDMTDRSPATTLITKKPAIMEFDGRIVIPVGSSLRAPNRIIGDPSLPRFVVELMHQAFKDAGISATPTLNVRLVTTMTGTTPSTDQVLPSTRPPLPDPARALPAADQP